jgi:20S proteasome subunit beta 3
MDPHLYIGLGGLGTDVQTLEQRLRFRKNLYELREGRKIAPRTLAQVLSNLLYEHR